MDVTAGETATDISEPSPLAAPTPVVKRPAGEKTPLASSPPAIIKRASLPKAERLALPVESGMEQLFTRVTVGPIGGAMAEAAAVDDGKTWCGPCDYRVPRWFGRNCISGQCPLKGKGG